MEAASQFKEAGMYTSAPGRGKILWTDRSCRGGNLGSSHSANGALSGGLRVDSSTLGFNEGKSIWKDGSWRKIWKIRSHLGGDVGELDGVEELLFFVGGRCREEEMVPGKHISADGEK